MPRQKGYKCDVQTRKNMSIGALSRESRIIKRYGLTKEFYDEQITTGNIWCSMCKQFRARALFGNGQRLVRCTECDRKLNASYYERNRDSRLKDRRKRYKDNQPQELRRRKEWFFKQYGADHDWYDSTLESQGGGCAICGAKAPDTRSVYFFVDHRHGHCSNKSGCKECLRGLLCNHCNSSLPRIERDPEWGAKALAYLARYQCLNESRS